jgi:hypothetical protein
VRNASPSAQAAVFSNGSAVFRRVSIRGGIAVGVDRRVLFCLAALRQDYVGRVAVTHAQPASAADPIAITFEVAGAPAASVGVTPGAILVIRHVVGSCGGDAVDTAIAGLLAALAIAAVLAAALASVSSLLATLASAAGLLAALATVTGPVAGPITGPVIAL